MGYYFIYLHIYCKYVHFFYVLLPKTLQQYPKYSNLMRFDQKGVFIFKEIVYLVYYTRLRILIVFSATATTFSKQITFV